MLSPQTGVDHVGPLYYKYNFRSDSVDEEEMHKCYVLLYTCTSTRGLVLDLVAGTRAKELIHSFRCFIVTRGCPRVVLSQRNTRKHL